MLQIIIQDHDGVMFHVSMPHFSENAAVLRVVSCGLVSS